MGIREFIFDLDLLEEKTQLFPDEICDDLWILYHGTSSIFEKGIEKNGLRWTPQLIKKLQVQQVVDIFDKMSWAGKRVNGYPVLKPFSLDSDFGNSENKPIFFAESSHRALLFATQYFAGGETAHSLRSAFMDLEEYLESKDLRRKHREYLKEEKWHYPNPNPPIRIDLVWLRSELDKLDDLKNLCKSFTKNHIHGVVYAIRFQGSDLSYLVDGGNMGVKTFKVVPPNKIVAKVKIPKDFEYDSYREDRRQLNALLSEEGLVGKLRLI